MNKPDGQKRVALICPADDYVGPALAQEMARRGFDLVVGGTLAAETRAAIELTGATVIEVAGSMHDLDLGPRMVAAALERFGRFHSVFFSSGRIALGRFQRTNIDDLRHAFEGNVAAPYAFVQAVLPTLIEQEDGQILVATSATAVRPTASASLYAGTRAAATMMLQSAAIEVVERNVQLNVVGTNFMDFPGFLAGNRAETPEGRARVEAAVPMKRLGTMTEFAQFCAVLLDGTSRFQTGQFFSYSGGWSL
jgi:NAD(P)-dependent dehydrogenase (short-subunit alcohol dehydrogenase family)